MNRSILLSALLSVLPFALSHGGSKDCCKPSSTPCCAEACCKASDACCKGAEPKACKQDCKAHPAPKG